MRLLEAREINQVLSENFSIWSPGLDRSGYRHYQWWQLRTPWGRRNLQYFGLVSEDGRVLASCKRYKFSYSSRGRKFRFAGIGAVWVSEANRGKSYGLKLLKELAEQSKQEEFDALILNSDIDPAYYERLGYHLFDASSFSIKVNQSWLRASIKELDANSDRTLDESFNIRSPSSADIAEMCRHHRRWLSRQQFGMSRSEDYWNFKVGRERYLFKHSRLNWPKMDIITDNYGKYRGGYALIEQSGEFLRVLEVIGSHFVRSSIWSQILRLAERRKIGTIRGWKIMAPPLKDVPFHKRDWSFPMICPLQNEFADEFVSWTESDPPTILELDHF